MFALTVPIVLEQLLRVLISSVDTIMLSSFSQEAVAGVGMMGQYIFFIQILFNVICIGTSIVLAQYLGAKRMTDVRHVAQGSAVMTLVVAVIIGITVAIGARPLLSLYDVDPMVRKYATQFFMIYGGASAVFMAFNMLQGTILRAYGYTRDAMYIAVATNVINVIGNSFALYGWFGLPVTGVVGVAISSTFAQVAACFLMAWRIRLHPDVQFPLKGWRRVPRTIYRTILSVGVPTAGENMSYNVAQIVIMAMVSTLGTLAMSAMVYTQTIARFVYIIALSIGNAVQIKTGYYVGARQPEAAYRRLYRYQIIGTSVSLSVILFINLIKGPLIGLFTHQPEIAALTSTLLLFSILIETGRSLNLIVIPGLKGAGDVKFPVLYGIFNMWFFMVLGGWLLCFHAGLGLTGIWIAIGTDETLRGVVMLFRWKSKRWMQKAIA
jgi:putative MATE family efflux protein